MNFIQKIGAIYHYALHGKPIKQPLKLLSGEKIATILKYLTSHNFDDISLELILN